MPAKAFRPVRGLDKDIRNQVITDGFVYFATDSGKIYLDKDGKRYEMGGSSASTFIFANGNESQIVKQSEDSDDKNYTMAVAALEESDVLPKPNSIIVNSDGRFFRVVDVNDEEHTIHCTLIAVSGTGGGGEGGGVVSKPDLTLSFNTETIDQTMTFIKGQSYKAEFTATSDTDSVVSLSFIVTNSEGQTVYTYLGRATSGEVYEFDTKDLPVGNNLKLTVTATAANSKIVDGVKKIIPYLNVVEMGITKSANMAAIASAAITSPTDTLVKYYLIGGASGLKEDLHVAIDGNEDASLLKENITVDTNEHSVGVPRQTHGVHTVSLWVSTVVNEVELKSESITYELAWADDSSEVPIIWTEEYSPLVVQYENFAIKYMVYDPKSVAISSKAEVQLYKEGVLISTVNPQYNATGGWLTWDLTELYAVGTNHFSIRCGITSRDITFEVTTEGSRDLGLVQTEALMLNLSATGRTNEESADKRAIWADPKTSQYNTEFSNFNWYNNGWKTDTGANEKFGSYLSIANGASAKINFSELGLNSNDDYSIELRFRVRNIQEYSTLVTVDPHYFVMENGVQSQNSVSITEIKKRGLTVAVDRDGNWLMDEANSPKIVKNDEGVCFKWLDSRNYGLCVGTQEAYFRTPAGTVNVRYKEDEIINMAFVISAQTKLVSIYLNGILSGESSLTTAGPFTVMSDAFEINSKYCDVDIYKLRVYRHGLTMPEVIHNYISDIHDINLYDQNQLTKDTDPTALSYSKLVAYNAAQAAAGHMDRLTMPYAVIEIIDNQSGLTDPNGGTHSPTDDRLPYYKGNDRYCKVTFTNPSLDYDYDHGNITQDYYIAHCPSYVATGAEINVQGTSSQGYPRRNFKTKMKSAAKGKDGNSVKHKDWSWEYTNENLRSQLESPKFEKWHEDNETYATDKFTWKIDYMESSGSYNTGFANMVGKMYDKHPLQDYNLGISTTDLRTSVYGFPLLVFWKHSTPTDLAKVGTKTEDDIYEFIGRYNMNLDKGSNECYGFEDKTVQPYVDYTTGSKQVTDKTSGETSTVTTYTLSTGEVLEKLPTVADVAECWELTDNQGTWTSFTYPANAEGTKFKTKDVDGVKLEVLNHFEYRYIPNDKVMDEAMAYKTGGTFTNNAEIDDYLYKKYSNLEKVFNWLNSTDTRKATGASLPEPVTYGVVGATEGDDEHTTYEYQTVRYQPTDPATGKPKVDAQGSPVYETRQEIIKATYTTDCVGYRLQKFRNEFSNHIDKEYATVYYIMTELCLCYDSRGKNLMFATYGPQKKGGEYIWYPIFYDIDTQLGLNNIGATLWDYDTDASKDLTFSTPSSVLWNNFGKMFASDIKSKYQTLRASSRLTQQVIDGSYGCDPAVFTSYAMKGLRPIIAIGLDEYVKYVKPSINGYYDTSGNVVPDNNSYAYAVNGDRKLSRELFIRNRLNYMDSYWMAGEYTSEATVGTVGTGITMRANANNSNTSDKYLDSGLLQSLPSNAWAGEELKKYPVPYFDATPSFTIKPFLAQYVFTFNDKIPSGASVKYDGTHPVETTVSDSVTDGYKQAPGFPEQIIYIPGSDYLTDVGDLSLKYPSQLTIVHGKRLLNIKVGSDVPGYVNNLLKGGGQLNLNDSATSSSGTANENRKTLLQSVNLTNLAQLSDAIDVSGSEKLTEFRALGTQITRAIFAEGAPLDTVHLPATVNGLSLVESKNLTRILEQKPVVCTLDESGNAVYADKKTYSGLYIEGVTDSTSATNKMALDSVNIIGSGLGYDSYKLLDKLVTIKKNMIKITPSSTIGLNFEEVEWSPYTQLPKDATYDSSKTYYRLTDHSNFVTYTFTTSSEWNELLLNGKLFTYNPNTDEAIIKDTSIFDTFLSDYDQGVASGNKTNHFTNLQNTGKSSVPNLTGSVFISNANGTPINEEDITDKYQVRWPNLNFYAANINEAYVAKYVQLTDEGKEQEIELLRSSKNETTPKLTTKSPTRSYYDFLGYATDKEGTNIVADYDAGTNKCVANAAFNSVQFSPENSVITFYAIFRKHPYVITYKNPDDSVLTTRTATYGDNIPDPGILPSTDETGLALEQTYSFKGYTKERANAITTKNKLKTVLLNLSKTSVTQDTAVYACYVQQSVYDSTLSSSFFETGADEYVDPLDTTYNASGKYLRLKKGVELAGKITLPTVVDGKPITSIQGFQEQSKITHVFFDHADQAKLRVIQSVNGVGCFYNDAALVYFQFPEGLREIQMDGFRYTHLETLELPQSIMSIDSQAFARISFAKDNDGVLDIPGNLAYYGDRMCINWETTPTAINIGDADHPCKMRELMGSGYAIYFQSTSITGINIYCTAETEPTIKKLIEDNANSRSSLKMIPVTYIHV